GLEGSASVTVTVGSEASDPAGIELTVEAYKDKGEQVAVLDWTVAIESVDVYRDGSRVVDSVSENPYTHRSEVMGGGTATYKVCEAGTATCSNEVTATW
ncbi:MAG: S8 family serine peptidase, partial [Actinomycetota bacterium]